MTDFSFRKRAFLRKSWFASAVAHKLRKLFDGIFSGSRRLKKIERSLSDVRDLLIDYQTRALQGIHDNPLNSYGRKGFSQTDEDGITIEIVMRLGLVEGIYAEFGVGDGVENNTLILASMGWKGFWVGGDDLAFIPKPSKRFCFLKSWVTLDNIVELAKDGLARLHENNIDLLCVDLDGNDIYLVEKLLANGLKPKVFVVEYNAQFPPPSRFKIEYDPTHVWNGDNYFGAALQNFVDLFQSYGFTLICCNSHTGANAFFIKDEYLDLFDDVPKEVSKLFVPPRYFLYNRYGHKQSVRVIESILKD
jgi:hypothetical protein